MASAARSLGRLAVAARQSSLIGNHLARLPICGSVSPLHRGALNFAAARGFLTTSHPRHGVVCFKLADIGEGIASVELTKWYKKVGDDVEEMEEICEVQSDKAAVEITSRYTGKIVKLYPKEGDAVKVGGPLMDIDSPDLEDSPSEPSQSVSAADEPKQAEASKRETEAPPPPSSKSGESLASPAVRRFAKEKGVDLKGVTGSGPRGAITKEDVLKFLNAGPSASSGSSNAQTPPAAASPKRSTPKDSREDREVVLQGFSKAMVKSMNDSVKVPHMNIGDEYDVTRLTAVRRVVNKELADQNIRLSLTAFLIKAMSIAIHDYPIVNSKFNVETQNSYTEYGSHNVSVAIDSPGGLVVPCVKNVQDLTLLDIQQELVRLQGLAKANRLSPSDLTGGTISLSNVGVISGTYIHPLLFDGQAVIVGVGRQMRVPRVVDRETEQGMETSLEARDIINCSFSADHRHCDGATITRFSKRIKTLLENPELMLAYLK
ncbi:hypothetical protein Efla_003942 [Eimeria flavescens]